MIYSRRIVGLKIIRSAVYALRLLCKELECTNIPLDPEILNRVLMMLNLTLSETLIKQWVKKIRSHLECENNDRKKFEITVNEI